MDSRRSRASESKNTITPEQIYRQRAAKDSENSVNGSVPQDETSLDRDLRAQTPSKRRIDKKNTSPEPGTSRRRTHIKTYHVKEFQHTGQQNRKNKKRGMPVFLSRLIIIGLMYAVLLPISIFFIYLWLPHHSTPETKDYTLKIGLVGQTHTTRTYSSDTVYHRDVYYTDMTTVAEYFNLAITGDSSIRKFTVQTSYEEVLFRINQSSVRVNGVEITMEAPCREIDGRIFAPVSFVNRCFDGISAEVNEEDNTINITGLTDKTGKEIPISLLYKQVVTAPHISFESLDKDFQQYIIRQSTPEEPEDSPIPDEGNEMQ